MHENFSCCCSRFRSIFVGFLRDAYFYSRFRPTYPVSAVADQLAFDSDSEALEFLTENKITVSDSMDIDCKDSLEAIANLNISD